MKFSEKCHFIEHILLWNVISCQRETFPRVPEQIAHHSIAGIVHVRDDIS